MSDFRVIYRILRELSDAIDAEEYDPRRLAAEAVGVPEPYIIDIIRHSGTG